jgi:hypothetical protein
MIFLGRKSLVSAEMIVCCVQCVFDEGVMSHHGHRNCSQDAILVVSCFEEGVA